MIESIPKSTVKSFTSYNNIIYDASRQNRPRHQLHCILQELRLPCTCKSRGFVTPASQLHPNRFQSHLMQEFAVVLNVQFILADCHSDFMYTTLAMTIITYYIYLSYTLVSFMITSEPQSTCGLPSLTVLVSVIVAYYSLC